MQVLQLLIAPFKEKRTGFGVRVHALWTLVLLIATGKGVKLHKQPSYLAHFLSIVKQVAQDKKIEEALAQAEELMNEWQAEQDAEAKR